MFAIFCREKANIYRLCDIPQAIDFILLVMCFELCVFVYSERFYEFQVTVMKSICDLTLINFGADNTVETQSFDRLSSCV